jgi:hypothetical protein
MKTLSGTLALVVLAVIVTLVIVSWFLTYKMVPNQRADHQLFLTIGTNTLLKKTYVDWTSEHDFDDALKQVSAHGGAYKIYKLKPGGTPYKTEAFEQIIETKKVTKSKVADDAAAGESAANDPNVMNKVAVAVENKDDIKKVLDALSPTPAPTP